MRGIEIAIEITKMKKQIFQNYREIGEKIKEAAKAILKDPSLRVIIFGSVPKKTYTPLSDLDVLIISKNTHILRYGDVIERLEKVLHQKLIGVEIHLVTPEEFERWYKRFLDVYEEV